jgi:hypothetical protein
LSTSAPQPVSPHFSPRTKAGAGMAARSQRRKSSECWKTRMDGSRRSRNRNSSGDGERERGGQQQGHRPWRRDERGWGDGGRALMKGRARGQARCRRRRCLY